MSCKSSGKKGATSFIHAGRSQQHACTATCSSPEWESMNEDWVSFIQNIGVAIALRGMVEFTRGMSKQATSPSTALGQWHPASSLGTHQSEQGHHYIPSIVKFPYLFNDAKVLDLSPQSIESLYSNAAVLVLIFTILCMGIVRIPIDVISILRCRLSRWPLRQPTDDNRVYGFFRRYVLFLQPCS